MSPQASPLATRRSSATSKKSRGSSQVSASSRHGSNLDGPDKESLLRRSASSGSDSSWTPASSVHYESSMSSLSSAKAPASISSSKSSKVKRLRAEVDRLYDQEIARWSKRQASPAPSVTSSVFADLHAIENAPDLSDQLKALDKELSRLVLFLVDQFLPEDQPRVCSILVDHGANSEYAKMAKAYMQALRSDSLEGVTGTSSVGATSGINDKRSDANSMKRMLRRLKDERESVPGISTNFRLLAKYQKDLKEVRSARRAIKTVKDPAYLDEVRSLISRVRKHIQVFTRR